jgi:plasmid maintenance system antidote protein VapI
MIVRAQNLPPGADAFWDWMERRGLNQRQASKIVEIDHTYLNHIVSGRRRPSLEVAVRVARKTGIPVEMWSTNVDTDARDGIKKTRKR